MTMANRQVGNYRSSRARGASVPMPRQSRQGSFALLGKLLVAVLGLGLTAVTVVGIRQAVLKVNSQKIETVQIEGPLERVVEGSVKDAVNRFVATSLVAIDLDLLKQELEADPWIHEVNIRREWPGTLILAIEEEVPIARWGTRQLLNPAGQIFEPQDIAGFMQLPLLSGPQGSESMVMAQYQQFNQLLYPLGVRIRDLNRNARGALTLTLTNGLVVKLGRNEVLARMRRLVAFLQSPFREQINALQTIDLRYRNGLAVEPKSEQLSETTDEPEESEVDRLVAL
jgi:cell division protein FtsQ